MLFRICQVKKSSSIINITIKINNKPLELTWLDLTVNKINKMRLDLLKREKRIRYSSDPFLTPTFF